MSLWKRKKRIEIMSKIITKINEYYNEDKGDNKLKVIFIRLGKGRKIQKAHIDSNRLYIGYRSDSDEILGELNKKTLSKEEFKNRVAKFEKENPANGKPNNLAPSSLQSIYEDDGHTLWFTIVDGRLYYGFTDQTKEFKKFKDDAGCIRPMEGDWCEIDAKDGFINERSVSGKITKKGKYRGTTTEVDYADIKYLVHRILQTESAEKKGAEKALKDLQSFVTSLLPQLNEYDFETLVEMLFLSQGYQKMAKSSGAEKSYDLALDRPWDRTDGDKPTLPTFVQIKAAPKVKDVEEVYEDFVKDKAFKNYHKKGFLVSHSVDDSVGKKFEKNKYKGENIVPKKDLYLIGPVEIAKQCIDFGKVRWLLEKVI